MKTLKQQQPQKRVKKNVTNVTNVINKTGGGMIYKVPHCAEHYFDSLINPFDTEAGVCLPCDLFPLPSQKVKQFLRGTFSLGTTGNGWLVFGCPTASNAALARFTTSTSVGTTDTILNSYTNQQTAVFSSLPYTVDQLNSKKVQSRVVAYGCRIKYIGTLMNQQGIIFPVEDPDHIDLRDFTPATISGLQYTHPSRVGNTKDWDAAVCYSGPAHPVNLEYMDEQSQIDLDRLFMGFVVAGGAGDKYEFEIVAHIEYIGTGAAGRTPSHADAHAFGKTMEIVKGATASQPLQPSMTRPLWERFKTALVDGLPKLASGAIQVVSSAFSGDMSKLLTGSQDLYRGVQPTVRALLEKPAQRGYMVGSPYLAIEPPKLLVK